MTYRLEICGELLQSSLGIGDDMQLVKAKTMASREKRLPLLEAGKLQTLTIERKRLSKNGTKQDTRYPFDSRNSRGNGRDR